MEAGCCNGRNINDDESLNSLCMATPCALKAVVVMVCFVELPANGAGINRMVLHLGHYVLLYVCGRVGSAKHSG